MFLSTNLYIGMSSDVGLTGTAEHLTGYVDLRLRRCSGQEHQHAYYDIFSFHFLTFSLFHPFTPIPSSDYPGQAQRAHRGMWG